MRGRSCELLCDWVKSIWQSVSAELFLCIVPLQLLLRMVRSIVSSTTAICSRLESSLTRNSKLSPCRFLKTMKRR